MLQVAMVVGVVVFVWVKGWEGERYLCLTPRFDPLTLIDPLILIRGGLGFRSFRLRVNGGSGVGVGFVWFRIRFSSDSLGFRAQGLKL